MSLRRHEMRRGCFQEWAVDSNRESCRERQGIKPLRNENLEFVQSRRALAVCISIKPRLLLASFYALCIELLLEKLETKR